MGDIYECTNTFVLVNPATEQATLMTMEAYKQAAGFDAYAGRPPPAKDELPHGTRFELISIHRRNQSSWNNGISYAYRSTVRFLSGARTNQTATADGLFLLLEGQGGRPVQVPMRLVGRGEATAARH